jgi:hypothetical protein
MFYVGHVDKSIFYETHSHCNILSKHYHHHHHHNHQLLISAEDEVFEGEKRRFPLLVSHFQVLYVYIYL